MSKNFTKARGAITGIELRKNKLTKATGGAMSETLTITGKKKSGGVVVAGS